MKHPLSLRCSRHSLASFSSSSSSSLLKTPTKPNHPQPTSFSNLQIGEDIAKETSKDWKGLRVTVKLTVQNRQAKVTVVPSAAALVIKALKEPVRDRKKEKNVPHNGNISLDDIKEIARIMRDRSCAATFAAACKEILGTAVSVGCTVDNKEPREIQKAIDDGEIVIPDE
jgi:large subunit ribosomal protein L12e